MSSRDEVVEDSDEEPLETVSKAKKTKKGRVYVASCRPSILVLTGCC